MNSLFLSLSAAAVGNCCHVGQKSPDVQGLPVLVVSELYYAHCRKCRVLR